MGFFKKRATPDLPVEVVIVGLGNPGPQYSGTRHNIGFEVVEALARKHSIQLKTHKFQAQFGTGAVDGRGVALVKPLTFMNLSGQAVAAVCRHFGVLPASVMVVTDDLDMDVGRIKLRERGSSGGHNGHKSIIQALKTEDYPRLKVGIGKVGETVDHVLSKFKPDEREVINDSINRCVGAIEVYLNQGIERAMNEANRRSDQDRLD